MKKSPLTEGKMKTEMKSYQDGSDRKPIKPPPMAILPEKDERIKEAIEYFENYGDGPAFVKYKNFAILNEQAFDIYLEKEYDELIQNNLRIANRKLKKIREFLEL